MVRSDQSGWSGHGLVRLPQYAMMIRRGVIKVDGRVSVLRDEGATGVLSGGDGMGHPAMAAAVEMAVMKAQNHGVGWVGLRHGNHAGPMGVYVQHALDNGCAVICGSTSAVNHMAPWGGVESLLGSNPLCFAVPAGEQPSFVFDMSTSVAAAGQIKARLTRGEKLPDGWVIDRDGAPADHYDETDGGTILPVGGAKGYGLSLAVALLGAGLHGGALGREVLNPTEARPDTPNVGSFVVAVQLARFGTPEAITSAIDVFLADLRNSGRRQPDQPIRIPGEEIAKRIRSSEADGLPLAPSLREALSRLAAQFDVAPL